MGKELFSSTDGPPDIPLKGQSVNKSLDRFYTDLDLPQIFPQFSCRVTVTQYIFILHLTAQLHSFDLPFNQSLNFRQLHHQASEKVHYMLPDTGGQCGRQSLLFIYLSIDW